MSRFRFAPFPTCLALLLAGSTAHGAWNQSEFKPLEYATTLVQVPVLLRPADRNRVDSVGDSRRVTVPSGAVFASVFTGSQGKGVPVVEIRSASIQEQPTALGLHTTYSCQVSAVLHLHGDTRVLTAVGTDRERGRNHPEAHAQLACERAAVDLAKQVQTLLALGKHPEADAPPGEFHSHRRVGGGY